MFTDFHAHDFCCKEIVRALDGQSGASFAMVHILFFPIPIAHEGHCQARNLDRKSRQETKKGRNTESRFA
jgi:hypothetical protein